jgi:rhodanese-related sulfurtransferase
MGILDYFKKVETIGPDEVRKLIEEKEPGDYNLIDVRQPVEYQLGHLPGARLIPMDELPERMKELDPSKPTVTY